MNKDLEVLLKEAAEAVKRMTPKEREKMLKTQGEGWARAEASWPKSNYFYLKGVKVYYSIEDYYND